MIDNSSGKVGTKVDTTTAPVCVGTVNGVLLYDAPGIARSGGSPASARAWDCANCVPGDCVADPAGVELGNGGFSSDENEKGVTVGL